MNRFTLDSILDSYVSNDEYEVCMTGLLDAINSGDERETLRALDDLGAYIGSALVSIPLASFLVEDVEGACTDCSSTAYDLIDGELKLMCSIKKQEVSPFEPACIRYTAKDDSTPIDPEIIDEEEEAETEDYFSKVQS